MADEALRMEAEVRDKFSGPLKALRAQLLDVSREGAQHGETLAKGLNKAEAAAQATANTAKTVLNPAMAAIGVTGLSAGVAVAGVVSALNSLGSNLSSLGQLSRETGMAADQLRIFQSVAGKFGISGDAASAAAQVFSRNMRDIRRGVRETMGFLQSQTPAVAEFAIKLRGTKNNDEVNRITEEFLEQIPDAVDRGRLAERIYGSVDLGRLGDRSRGPIADLNRATEQKLGPLPKGAVESAERYERALADLRSSMGRVGDAIASELLGPAERFTTWVDEVVAGKRGDATKGLREGIRGIKTELEAVNWNKFGEDSLAILNGTTALAGTLAKAFHEIAEDIRYIRNGEYGQAVRNADGASGPLARRLAPRVGDDEINAQENVDRLRKLRDVAKEAAGHFIGQTQQRIGLIDTPEAAEKKLADAEAELNRLKARTPEQRQKEFETSTERLRKSIDGLSEQMKTQQGATAQKSSVDGDELFGGAKVQTAAYMGGGGFRRPSGLGAGVRLPGSGSGPGYGGEAGPSGRSAGRAFGGGRLNGLGGGSRLSGIDSGTGATPARGNLAANQQEAYRAARAEGLSDVAARALVANMSGESLRNPRDKHYDLKHTAEGIVQWDPPRAEAIRREFGASPRDMSVTDQTRAAIDEIRSNPRFGPTRRALESDDPSVIMRALVGNYENPRDHRQTFIDRMKHYRGFRPGAAVAEGGRPRVRGLERPDVSAADGEGWAAREKARKEFEAKMRDGEGRLDRSAGRAGVMGGPKVDASGSVVVNVAKPGPDTRVSTSASGNLFKDVVLRRGRPMASADGA